MQATSEALGAVWSFKRSSEKALRATTEAGVFYQAFFMIICVQATTMGVKI
jgi:hypothetical protein